MNAYYSDISIKSGTAGGTLFTIVGNIHYQDIVRTAVLASIGAIVSFVVSLLIKMVIKKFKRR